MVILWRNRRPTAIFGDGESGSDPPFAGKRYARISPLSSAHLLAIEHPRCPGCRRSRMVLCAVEPGPSGFDTRTFEYQKCGHVHTMTVSQDPMASSLHGWLTGELKPST